MSEVALSVKKVTEADPAAVVLVFDDATGRIVDLDLRGTEAEVIERLSLPTRSYIGRYRPKLEAGSEIPASAVNSEAKGRGRPKLGVIAREVTLLPKQWDWLSGQPGGASAVLRRLVDNARRSGNLRQQKLAAQEAAYQFMQAIAGDLPRYEEATRALFADNHSNLEQCVAAWPEDVRAYALRLAFDRSSLHSEAQGGP
jgi:hypothetical protein